jgi:hypothetical protein
MSKKPPPQVLFNFQEDNKNEITGEINPNFIYSTDGPNDHENELNSNDKEEEDFESYEDELIKIEEKEKPNEKDIFEDIPDSLSSPTPSEQHNKPVKTKKPRKPMSEDHKKKLGLAREKAMLVRKANAEEKKKMKALDNEEKELLKKQRFKKVKKLKEEVENEITEDGESKQVKVSNNGIAVSGITKKDLEEAQLDAIMKYEAIRKERKAKKKQEQIIEEGKMKMLNNIQRATGQYNYRDGSNRFDGCY